MAVVKAQWKDFWLIIVLALIFVLPQVGSYPLLEPDEARYVEIPREMVANGDYLIPRLNNIIYLEKPPLFYWLQTLPIKLFGIQEMALRFWNVFFAALTCGFTYLMAANLRDRQTGMIAAFMLFSSLMFYGLTHFMSLDMTLTAMVTGCLASVLLALNRESRRLWFYSAYIFAALAVMTKGLIGLLLPGMVVFLWLLFTKCWAELKTAYIPSGLLIFLGIAMPWHIIMQQAIPEFFDFYILSQHFNRYLTLSADRFEPFWFFVPILLAGLVPWLYYVGVGVRRSVSNRNDDNLFLLIWAFSIFIFFSVSKSKLIPYILPVLPPLFVLAACVVKRIKPVVITGAISLVVFTIAVPVWSNLADRSIKPLASLIQTNSYDEVASYNRYYQDLPVYIQDTVTVVNRKNELRFGSTLEDKSSIMIDDPVFWARWHQPEHRMMVMMSEKHLKDFQQKSERPVYQLGETSRHVLVSNTEQEPS